MRRAFATVVLVFSTTLAVVAGAAPSPGPPKATVVIYGQDPSAGPAEELRALVRTALTSEGGVTLVDAEWERSTFASPRPASWQGSLQKAQRLLAKAETDLREFDLKSAEANIAQVAQSLEPYLGLREAVAIDRERLHLAVAIGHAQRNEPEIDRLLAEYATRYPGLAPPEKKWPPDLFKRLENAAPKGKTKIEISAVPAGAAFVDGRPYGNTPVVASDVPPGRHRVEVEAPGCFPAQVVVDTNGLSPTPVALQPLPSVSLALARAKAEVPLDPALLAELRRLAGGQADYLVLVLKKKGTAVELRAIAQKVDDESPRYAGDATPAGLRLLVGQWRSYRERPPPGDGGPVPTWAFVGAGASAAAVGAGVLLRLVAVGTENDLQRREGAMTQSEAYDLHDRAGAQALGGSILMGVGLIALGGIASYVVFNLQEDEP